MVKLLYLIEFSRDLELMYLMNYRIKMQKRKHIYILHILDEPRYSAVELIALNINAH